MNNNNRLIKDKIIIIIIKQIIKILKIKKQKKKKFKTVKTIKTIDKYNKTDKWQVVLILGAQATVDNNKDKLIIN